MKRYLLASLLLVPLACSSGDDPIEQGSGACPEADLVGGVCTGVPRDVSLDASGVTCGTTHDVAGPGALDAAVNAAVSGDCIVLSPASYGSITLPDGVSLFSSHPDETTIAGLYAGGDATSSVTIRGLQVTGGGVVLRGGEVTIDAVRILDAPGIAIDIESGRATITRSEVYRAAGLGIDAAGAVGLTIEGSKIGENQTGGIWVAGADTCNDEAARVDLDISDSLLDGNLYVAAALFGAVGRIDNVRIQNGTPAAFIGGGGLSVAACSAITAGRLAVIDNDDWGVLIDDSDFSLDGGTIDRNVRGIWVQNTVSTGVERVSILNTKLTANLAVGFGITEGSTGVYAENLTIADTAALSIPVEVDGVSASAEEVGEGITWAGFSQARLTDVTISNSAVKPMTITEEVGTGSIITRMSVDGGMESTLSILHQKLPVGGVTPDWVGGQPTVETTPDQIQGVPSSVTIPPGI